VIDLRLRSLPPHARRVLSACSVVGTEFSVDLVAQALCRPWDSLEAELDVATRRGILRRLDALDAPRYEFAHPLFGMRLYDSLPAPERRRLHSQIARAADAGGVLLSVSELARHHALGARTGADPNALKHCRAAAEEAEKLLAYEEAAHFWELALGCAPGQPRRLRAGIYDRLGRALWAAKKWEEAGEAWSEAVSLFDALDDRARAASLALALGDMHRWRNELAQAERWVKRALDGPLEDQGDQARALALLGHIHCSRDDADRGLPLLEEAARLAAGAGGDPFVTYWLSYGYLTSGQPSKAYPVAKEGLVQAQHQGNERAVTFLAGSLVHHELGLLHLEAARSYARVLERSIEPTDTPGLSRSLLCRALLGAYVGNWRSVVRLCEQWMAQVRLAGRFQVATARMIWAEAKLALGDPAAALKEMTRTLPDLAEMHLLGGLHLARVLVRQGKADGASLLVHQFLERATSGARHSSPRALLGDIVSDLEVPELWHHCYNLLERETRPMLAVYSPISVQRVQGRLATRLRLWPQAVEHFECTLRRLAEGKAAWELAQTYLAYAEMRRTRRRRGDLTKAAALELQGEAIFTRLRTPRPALRSASQPLSNRFALTERELDVLRVLAEGRRNTEIAEVLAITTGTVQRHLENIFGKMGVGSRTEAATIALHEGLVGPLADRLPNRKAA